MHRSRILIIDDLFGREVASGYNPQRANICAQYLLRDVSEGQHKSPQEILEATADAVFFRGQSPMSAAIGDEVTNDLDGTMEVIRSGWQPSGSERNWALVLLDLCFYTGSVTSDSNRRNEGMPEGSSGDADPTTCFGLQILKSIQEEFPDLPVVILSSMPRKEVAQEFVNSGARGFIARDQGDPELLRTYLARYGLIPDWSGTVIGFSRSLLVALRDARMIASNNQHTLIRGEAGTGKDLLARYIHDQSDRRGKNFEVVSIPAVPLQLVEDALFGHVKGAFTGAEGSNATRQGAFELANEGTLFLDEVGDTPPEAQPKLLRVLQNGEVQRLGADGSISIDVRVISATNVDIESQVATGEGFRRDLFDRLREGGTIFLPPLRARKDDISILAEHFVREAEAERPGALRRQVSASALDKLKTYDWPGNIRELRQVIRRAVNTYPDVEYLVPVHINLPAMVEMPSSHPLTVSDVDELVRVLDEFEFRFERSDICGSLPKLREAYLRLISRYLETVLTGTAQNRTPENPLGEIRIQPSINLMMGGGEKISGSRSADLIKSMLNTKEAVIRNLMDEPERELLRIALDKALKLRPKSRN